MRKLAMLLLLAACSKHAAKPTEPTATGCHLDGAYAVTLAQAGADRPDCATISATTVSFDLDADGKLHGFSDLGGAGGPADGDEVSAAPEGCGFQVQADQFRMDIVVDGGAVSGQADTTEPNDEGRGACVTSYTVSGTRK